MCARWLLINASKLFFQKKLILNILTQMKTIGYWCGPKVATQKENTEHGLEVRKIYKQKLQRIVSTIGSRTTSTLVLLQRLLPY